MTNRTNVTLLLDRSGSMGSVKDATIEAFNGYVTELKKGDDIFLTFLQFDSQSIDKIHVGVPIAEVPELTEDGFMPRASTPLIDAAVKTIRAVERAVKPGDKVVICIQTDGQENSSVDHTWEELSALVKTKSEEGWQFNFMGAGINAFTQGARMGVSGMSTMSYDGQDKVATREAFAATASNTRAYASGATQNVNYSRDQRYAAGEHRTAGAAAGAAVIGVVDAAGVVAPVERRPTVRMVPRRRGMSLNLGEVIDDGLDLTR